MKDSNQRQHRKLTRRDVLGYGAVACASTLLPPSVLLAQASSLLLKTIPSSGEAIPPIGIGTNQYGAGTDPAERAVLLATLKRFAELGGRLIDTAPVYENSELVLGGLIAELGQRDELFIATKTDLRGAMLGSASYEQSYQKLRMQKTELMQVHNLTNANEELAALRDWRDAGKVKYIGITTAMDYQYAEMETLMNREKMDFIQVDYSLDNRGAAERLLPLAQDKGLAVLVNLPFGRGSLFAVAEGRELPAWAAEFDAHSWGQFFLKYIISHPAVTAAIPGTRKVHHAEDNVGAAMGRLPDAAQRQRMERFFDELT